MMLVFCTVQASKIFELFKKKCDILGGYSICSICCIVIYYCYFVVVHKQVNTSARDHFYRKYVHY